MVAVAAHLAAAATTNANVAITANAHNASTSTAPRQTRLREQVCNALGGCESVDRRPVDRY